MLMPIRPIERTPEAYSFPLLIKHLLHAPLTCAAEQEIVYRDRKRLSYRGFRQRLGQLASGLTELGVVPGDTVAMMDWDSHRFLECFFAIPMMGAILHTVNIRHSASQILYTLNESQADVILVHSDFVPLVESIQTQLKTVKKIVLIRDDTRSQAAQLSFASDYEEMLAASHPDFNFEDFDENARATTLFTSGTTGPPKGVYFSHRQIVLHTLSVMAALGTPVAQQRFHRGDVYMPITPMFHVHAWGLPYVATAMGVKQVYPGRYSAELLLELLEKERVTFSHCVPTVLQMLLSCPRSRHMDLSHWKVVVGASALPSGLAADALERKIDIFTGYGMSESCPILTLSQLPCEANVLHLDGSDIRKKGGMPIPLVDLRIVDQEMGDVPHDGKASGEVVARAPWATQGYLNDAQSSSELWRYGYLHTGDLGSMDAAGYLEILDRIKDVIKSGGEWISSLELERTISQHPGVNEVAVIGVCDDKWGERPLALVVPRPGFDVHELRAQIEKHFTACVHEGSLSKWAVPERILFLESLTRTNMGKLDKKLLRQQFADRAPEVQCR
jgi:fatty-acyl-CoA synthase